MHSRFEHSITSVDTIWTRLQERSEREEGIARQGRVQGAVGDLFEDRTKLLEEVEDGFGRCGADRRAREIKEGNGDSFQL